MKRTREQRRAELVAEAKAVIEELLAWEEQAGAPNLTELEDEVLQLRQRLGQRMLEVLMADQAAGQPAEAPTCAQCGQTLRYKGQKETGIETRLGGVTLARGYYACAHCDSGLFPPG